MPSAKSTTKATATRVKKGHYKAAQAAGEMYPGEVLDREAFCKRFGTTRETVYEWERMGLKIRGLGKRRFILAGDFYDFLLQRSEDKDETPEGDTESRGAGDNKSEPVVSREEFLPCDLKSLIELLTAFVKVEVETMSAAQSDKPIRPNGQRDKPKRQPPQSLPLLVVGGIDPLRTYSVPEFMAITRVTRQALSRMRRAEKGLIVRDAGGSPQILGQDWLDYLARAPKHTARMRRPGGRD